MVLAVLVNYKGRYHPRPSIRARSVGPVGSRTGPNPLLKILWATPRFNLNVLLCIDIQ